jgi:hypothetical protein
MDAWGVYDGRQPAGTKERFDSYDAKGGQKAAIYGSRMPRVAMSAMTAEDSENAVIRTDGWFMATKLPDPQPVLSVLSI